MLMMLILCLIQNEICKIIWTTCDAFGLTISIKKTKMMFTPEPGAPYIEPNIYVRERRLDVVDTFVYLGSTISRDGSLDAGMRLRIQRTSTTFGALEKRLWCDHGISVKTKISVYSTCVLSVLLYSSECWTTQRRQLRQLERFHQKCLRWVLNVKWQSMIPDTDILKKAECLSIEAMVMRNWLRWSGHVVRMEDVRLLKQLFYSELKIGKHPQHGPKRCFTDRVKDDVKAFKIPVQNWETLAKSCPKWSRLVRGGSEIFERERIDHAELKRNLRKGNVSVLPNALNSWKCETCNKMLLSKAAYINHNKIHAVCRGSRETEAEVKQVSTLNFVCHMCGRLCKSNAGLKSHLRAHRCGLGVTDDSPSNCGEGGDEHWDGCHLLRWSNCHIYIYIYI